MLARNVLWYVTFAGFAINYMHRIHINIVLVGMVKTIRGSNTSAMAVSECMRENHYQNLLNSNSTTKRHVNEDGFEWDEQEQNQVLGSFYWLHWLTQIPGGMLARRFGTKKIFGLANFSGSLLTFAFPYIAYFDFRLLIFVRVLQGFIMGAVWPSMHHLTAHWIPPDERSKFVSSYLGSSFGVALTYPLCGYLMDMYGWTSAFHVTGAIATVWFICWWILVYDSPAQHPWITETERKYIESSLDHSQNNRKMSVPWKDILTSRPLWMVGFSQIGGIWGFYTLMTQAPTYFKNILGMNIRTTGVLSGLPHLSRWLMSLSSAFVADYLLRNNKMSRTNVRKLATSVCTIFQGVLILGLAFTGCNSLLAVILVVAATGANGTVSSGPLACIVDLSPNFASICLGIVGLMANLPGFLSPLVVGYLTYQNQTALQWQKVFFVTSGILFFFGTLYMIYGEANVQPWNNKLTEQPRASELDQLEKLNSKESEKNSKEMTVIKNNNN
ncbi:sialin [Nilaparvata lugens]|uniref:sialin n=1 Tax=Nilaparvata lugens TaxID=108931 RepID=UPI00193D6BA7|nr:sialin [Nilaparvata lugens]